MHYSIYFDLDCDRYFIYLSIFQVMVDHHTASEQFMMDCKREASEGRTVPADWGWIIPPISASATKVFHQEFENILLKPNLFPQPEPWKNLGA